MHHTVLCKTKLPAHAYSIAVCSGDRILKLSYFKFATMYYIMHGVRWVCMHVWVYDTECENYNHATLRLSHNWCVLAILTP